MIRPELEVIKSVIFQKKGWVKQNIDFYILYVPRRTIECDEELENEKVHYFCKILDVCGRENFLNSHGSDSFGRRCVKFRASRQFRSLHAKR